MVTKRSNRLVVGTWGGYFFLFRNCDTRIHSSMMLISTSVYVNISLYVTMLSPPPAFQEEERSAPSCWRSQPRSSVCAAPRPFPGAGIILPHGENPVKSSMMQNTGLDKVSPGRYNKHKDRALPSKREAPPWLQKEVTAWLWEPGAVTSFYSETVIPGYTAR